MKLNPDKCHFLIAANSHEPLRIKDGESLIWESPEENLLGVTIDKNLKFNTHSSTICKKASQKVSALTRVAKFLPFHRKEYY